MEKVKIEFDSEKKSTFKAGDVYVEVTPYLSVSAQSALISQYIEDMYSKEGQNLIENVELRRMNAELSQMLYIVQSQTNIDFESLDQNLFLDSGYWKEIIDRIDNYSEFRERQEQVLFDYESQLDKANSAGIILSGLIEKLSSFIEQIGDITPESITALQETGKDLIERLEKSSVVEDMERGAE